MMLPPVKYQYNFVSHAEIAMTSSPAQAGCACVFTFYEYSLLNESHIVGVRHVPQVPRKLYHFALSLHDQLLPDIMTTTDIISVDSQQQFCIIIF